MKRFSLFFRAIIIAITSIAIFVFLYIGIHEWIVSESQANNSGDYVVLLHGLGRTRRSMYAPARFFAKQNYKVILVSYPSTRAPIDSLASDTLAPTIARLDPETRIHFVTHSLGGIVVREYLAHNTVANLGRIVSMAPPNQGSYLADSWSKSRIGSAILGPALGMLTTQNNSYLSSLPAPTFELGIIAGDADEKVTTSQTQLEGATDHIIVASEHTFIMRKRESLEAALRFLQSGSFIAIALEKDSIAHMLVAKIPKEKIKDITFFWKENKTHGIRTIPELKTYLAEEEGKTLQFATNGGIFSTEYKPLGLYIENGELLSPINYSTASNGNFFWQPNGIFGTTVDNAAFITTTDKFIATSTIRHAVQSGPMLVIDSAIHPDFSPTSTSAYIRSGVGITQDGTTVFAISTRPRTFYDFATYFKNTLGAEQALYLDGAISEMYTPSAATHLYQPFATMIGIVVE